MGFKVDKIEYYIVKKEYSGDLLQKSRKISLTKEQLTSLETNDLKLLKELNELRDDN